MEEKSSNPTGPASTPIQEAGARPRLRELEPARERLEVDLAARSTPGSAASAQNVGMLELWKYWPPHRILHLSGWANGW